MQWPACRLVLLACTYWPACRQALLCHKACAVSHTLMCGMLSGGSSDFEFWGEQNELGSTIVQASILSTY